MKLGIKLIFVKHRLIYINFKFNFKSKLNKNSFNY